MDKEKVLQLALMLSDIAEGANNLIEAVKLISTAIDDVADMLREYATSE